MRLEPAEATSADCAVLMLAAGFIAEHQPPLRLRRVSRDVEAMLWSRSRVEAPERWSPDADTATAAALAYGRSRTARKRIACSLEKGPFVHWRPGRGELVLSTPVLSPKGDFAVVDAAVLLPGQRVDHYRFMLSGPPRSGWDLHRITFESARLPTVR